MNNWAVYLVRCFDDTFYCGITNDIKKRLATHNAGKGAKYTRTRRPVILLIVSKDMSKSEACKLEYQVKQQRRDRKVDYLKQFCK